MFFRSSFIETSENIFHRSRTIDVVIITDEMLASSLVFLIPNVDF